jgi:UDP-N-acetylglucosamine 2-epimerase (non-hydrolysing)
MQTPKPVLLIFGTRPEAIKLCPLISILRSEPFNHVLVPIICLTGQHREMLDQVLQVFDVRPDFDLKLMRPNQTLAELSARLLQALPEILAEVRPALCVVQGDTTTTFCGALSAFYTGVEVVHVEAGLRTFDLRNPFPEEANRLLTARLTALHFAATERAARNLRNEGVPPERIEVTGNTGIDAVLSVRDRLQNGAASGLDLQLAAGKKLVVITAHRRESFGAEFQNLCRAVAALAQRGDLEIVWPVHRNPNVTGPVETLLRGKPNITLVEPLDYLPFVDLMCRAHVILTDSGGIQEEAPSLGKPVLVLRNMTERPEAVEAGTVKLVGTDPDRIVEETARLLEDEGAYQAMARRHNPYGEGDASLRIARRIARHLLDPAVLT